MLHIIIFYYFSILTPMRPRPCIPADHALLNPRILLLVFQHLDLSSLLEAGAVCSVWEQVAQHHTLWTCVEVVDQIISNKV